MPRPNILFITTDQQHFSALGSVNPHIQTPALDRLTSEGVRFDRAYCVNPVCSPSRSTMITGLFPAWHHCWTIGVKLPEDVPTVGDALQANGYSTCLVGKAHFQPLASAIGSESIECQPALRDLDFWRSFQGPWYGFEHVETGRMHAAESHAGQHYALWLESKGLTNWRDYFEAWPRETHSKYGQNYTKGATTWELPEAYHHSHWIGERTIANIEQAVASGKPFFQWASFFDPHPGYVVPEPWASMYDPDDMPIGHFQPGEMDDMPPQHRRTREEAPDFSDYAEVGGKGLHGFHSHLHTDEELRKSLACYYGMMSLIDQEIGRILDCLDRLGVADNTLVLFSTDHGHFLGQHGLTAKGAFHYEDMLRIPMIARFPGRIPAGTVNSSLQSQIDWVPTFMDVAGMDVPGALQGHSQIEVWSGDDSQARDCIVVENRHNPTTVHLRSLVTDRYKITVYRGYDYGELFDLQDDPGELHNRWDDPAYAETKMRMMHRFLQAEMEREPTRMPRIAGA